MENINTFVNPFIAPILVSGEESYSSSWIDRLSGEWLDKGKVVAYSSFSGTITIEESDLTDSTPTTTKLVEDTKLTALTLYKSAELTLSKRFYRITIANSGEVTGNVIAKMIKTA